MDSDDKKDPLSEDPMFLMATIGQLSVWSFHDILNNIFKLEGFSEIAFQTVSKIEDEEIKADFKKCHDVMNTSIKNITNTVNRIRALRGKIEYSPADYPILSLIEMTQKKTQLPKKMSNIEAENIVNISLFCDKIIFEQIWFHLWKLLHQEASQGECFQAMCQFELFSIPEEEQNSTNIHIYIWLQQVDSSAFHPKELEYIEKNLSLSEDHVMYFTKKMGEKISCKILSSQTSKNTTIFRLSIPCKKTQV